MTTNFLNFKGIKISIKNRLHILIILIFNIFFAVLYGQNLSKNEIVTDTIPKAKDTLAKKESLDNVVKSVAAESVRTDIQKKMTYYTKEAKVIYGDMQVEADYISINWETGMVFARGKLDEKGKIIEPVIVTQGAQKYETDQLDFNYKTKQAIAYNARTEESGGVIVAEKTKKVNDSVFYMARGKYTTDDYFIKKKDTLSDYYLQAPNIKLIKAKKNSQIITGPIQMYIERVPTPLIMPFAILPFSDKRSAGLIVPSFGERESVGFYLSGLGYYQPIGEHFDLKILVDLYTKGSWNLRPTVNYKKNYKYSGNFSAEVGATITGIKGLDDYSKSSTYKITWTHSQDSKANPYLSFSASVNVVSTKFYNYTVNNNYIFDESVLNTQQNSTISLTKRFLTLPFTITGTSSYSQNFSTGTTTLRLPQLNVAVNQFYLFKAGKTGIREGLLQNITVNTALNFTNYVTADQEVMFKKEMWDDLQTGLQNTLSLATNTTFAKYFTFSLSASSTNVLSNKTVTKTYDPIENEVNTVYHKNIAGYSTFSTSASVQTTLYGNLNFGEKSKIMKVRHMVTPSLSFTYSPDFGEEKWGYFKHYYNATGALTEYSIFDGGTYGSPSSGLTQSLGFSIGNNLEMKVRSKSDSTGVKKIKIFESLSITGSYNFAAETHKWSMINFSGQTSLFNSKLSLNSTMVLDPYETVYDANGEGTRTNNFGKFSLQGYSFSMTFPMNNETFAGKNKPKIEDQYHTKGEIMYENYFFDQDHYARFAQNWSLNLSANYSFTKSSTSKFGNRTASIGASGSLKLTPFWNITGSTYYDVVNNKISYVKLGFALDQRSFSINFNWVPTGTYKVYDFFIGIKANILQDALKYKDRSFNQSSAPF